MQPGAYNLKAVDGDAIPPKPLQFFSTDADGNIVGPLNISAWQFEATVSWGSTTAPLTVQITDGVNGKIELSGDTNYFPIKKRNGDFRLRVNQGTGWVTYLKGQYIVV